MSAIDVMNDYRPSSWFEKGVWTEVGTTVRELVKATVVQASGIAALTAMLASATFAFAPDATASAFSGTGIEAKRADPELAAIRDLGSRIDDKLANFFSPSSTFDAAVLREAELTLRAIANRRT